MIYKLLSILIPLTLIIFTPKNIWDYILKNIEISFNKIIDIVDNVSGKVTLLRGQQLVNTLVEFESSSIIKLKTSTINIPYYKFYTQIIHQITHYGQKFGAKIKEPIKDIRKGLVTDLQFERKINKEFQGGIFQFFFISMIIYFFATAIEKSIGINLPNITLLTMITLQAIGLFLYIMAIRYIKKREFLGINNYISSIYILKSLFEVGIPIKLSLQESKVHQLKKSKKFIQIDIRINLMLERVQRSGTPILRELEELIEELWFLQKSGFEQFIKIQNMLKFIVLAFFFLPSYFIFLMELFNQFLIE